MPVEYQLLKEKILVIEGFYVHGLNARQLCFVPNGVLPQKPKVPDLTKYKGLSCPRSHTTMYCRNMASYINIDELLLPCFQDNLSGALLD